MIQVDDTVTDGPAKADTLPALIKQLEVTKSELESVKVIFFFLNLKNLLNIYTAIVVI